jgi:hypothetical protein
MESKWLGTLPELLHKIEEADRQGLGFQATRRYDPPQKDDPYYFRPFKVRAQPSEDTLVAMLPGLLYERRMMLQTGWILILDQRGHPRVESQIVRNGLLESFIVHLRLLREFLYQTPDSMNPTSLRAYDFFSASALWDAARPDETDLIKAARADANVRLVHFGTERVSKKRPQVNWRIDLLVRDIEAVLTEFRNSVDRISDKNVWKDWDDLPTY